MSSLPSKLSVNTAFDARDSVSTATKGEAATPSISALELLDKGEARVAEREASGKWKVNQWLKKAVLLSSRLSDNEIAGAQTRRRGRTRCPRSSPAGATTFAPPAFALPRAPSSAAPPSSPRTPC